MTPEEINRALAEVEGWVFTSTKIRAPNGNVWDLAPEVPHQIDGIIPNYYADLNAVHRAEEAMLKRTKWIGWQCPIEINDHIIYRTCEAAWLSWFPNGRADRATAAKRSDAVLRTLGLWVKNKNDNIKEATKAVT